MPYACIAFTSENLAIVDYKGGKNGPWGWWLHIGVGTRGALGAGAPLCFLNSYIARLDFIYTDHTALAYRSIEPPLSNHLPTPLSRYMTLFVKLLLYSMYFTFFDMMDNGARSYFCTKNFFVAISFFYDVICVCQCLLRFGKIVLLQDKLQQVAIVICYWLKKFSLIYSTANHYTTCDSCMFEYQTFLRK
jgi:hypothetical protein